MPEAQNPAAINNSAAVVPKPKLFDEVRPRLRLKHYGLRTEQACLCWIRRYIHSNDRRHSGELDGKHAEHFLGELARRYRVAPSAQNQALAALSFLYREVLAVDLPGPKNMVRVHQA